MATQTKSGRKIGPKEQASIDARNRQDATNRNRKATATSAATPTTPKRNGGSATPQTITEAPEAAVTIEREVEATPESVPLGESSRVRGVVQGVTAENLIQEPDTAVESREQESHEVENHEVENHEVENHEVENHEVENHEVENHEVENHEVENHEVENREVENREVENREESLSPADTTFAPLAERLLQEERESAAEAARQTLDKAQRQAEREERKAQREAKRLEKQRKHDGRLVLARNTLSEARAELKAERARVRAAIEAEVGDPQRLKGARSELRTAINARKRASEALDTEISATRARLRELKEQKKQLLESDPQARLAGELREQVRAAKAERRAVVEGIDTHPLETLRAEVEKARVRLKEVRDLIAKERAEAGTDSTLAEAEPPSVAPPSAAPPSVAPPNVAPPSAAPPSVAPPNVAPPSAAPPSAAPPSAAFDPQTPGDG